MVLSAVHTLTYLILAKGLLRWHTCLHSEGTGSEREGVGEAGLRPGPPVDAGVSAGPLHAPYRIWSSGLLHGGGHSVSVLQMRLQEAEKRPQRHTASNEGPGVRLQSA